MNENSRNADRIVPGKDRVHSVDEAGGDLGALHHLADPLDAEAPIDDRMLGFVLISEALKMLFEQPLEDVDSARLAQSLGDRGELKG
jgi:hypothetical protein